MTIKDYKLKTGTTWRIEDVRWRLAEEVEQGGDPNMSIKKEPEVD